ncbi:hypothetical protein MKX01_034187 [Papaver californicum]|nr:hypothetical protein MKX01_034187 [Papaver californicum]
MYGEFKVHPWKYNAHITRKAVFGHSSSVFMKLPYKISSVEKKNTTCISSKWYDKKGKNKKTSILSAIEWRFHSTDVVIVENGVDENTKLSSVIEEHLKLANTLIVEYPVIYVFLPSASYDVEAVKDAAPPLTINSEPMLKDETEEDIDEFFFYNFMDLEFPENSGLIGETNPDDFLDLDGEFLQGLSDEELEEGEIPT